MGQDAALRSPPLLSRAEDLTPLLDLVAVCLARDCTATAAMLDELPQPLSTFALAASWLAPANLLTEWRWVACDEPHTCDVNR